MSDVSKEEVTGLTLARDNEVVPVAKQMIKIIAEEIDNLPIGAHGTVGVATREEFLDAIVKVYSERIIPLLLESNLKLDHLGWIFMLMRQPFSEIQDITDRSFSENKEIADAVVYGILPGDMRVKDLDAAMKRKAVDNDLQGE